MNKSYRIIVTALLSGLCLNQATAEHRSVAHEERVSIEAVDQLVLSEVIDNTMQHAPESMHAVQCEFSAAPQQSVLLAYGLENRRALQATLADNQAVPLG